MLNWPDETETQNALNASLDASMISLSDIMRFGGAVCGAVCGVHRTTAIHVCDVRPHKSDRFLSDAIIYR